ncbi:MAG: AAA family ATPase, partial [Desulfobacterales bacterium]|nr:AAA family ATPase [Desulfobacterales bacterium]
LFRGLQIEQTDWQWKPHPVVKVDFSTIAYDTPERLRENLLLHVRRIAGEHGIQNTSEFLPYSFSTLITDLAKKCKEQAVVLIDEYDKPIIKHLGKGESALGIAKENRDILKSFFGVLKGGHG